MNKSKITLLAIMAILITHSMWAQVRIKDVVSVQNGQHTALVGYGLVVGLNGTGDRPSGNRGAVFTTQTISNMLERFGITVPKEQLRTRNVAAVMVTANLRPFSMVGSQFDVVVSSLGDANSLEGGVLLPTPLQDPLGVNYAMSQGPVSIGGYNIETRSGEQLRKNHALVGRVPGGGTLTLLPEKQNIDISKPLRLFLNEPDFITSNRIAEAINTTMSSTEENAKAVSPGIVEITFPSSVQSHYDMIRYVAAIETLMVVTDVDARVVINERTGTVVAGGGVTIGEVMISHGNLTIHTRSAPVISQPQAFSRTGQTVVTQVTNTVAEEEEARTAVIRETTTVSDLALALNTIGLKPRDIIAVFQSIKEAGALRARLIIN